jgi:hypothetical protein
MRSPHSLGRRSVLHSVVCLAVCLGQTPFAHAGDDDCDPLNINLTNATSTWIQDCGASFIPFHMIDRNPATSWATVRCLPPGDRSLTETAVFETTSDLVAGSTPVRLTFKIYSGGFFAGEGSGNLTLGHFALSTTSANRAEFADGRAVGGLIGPEAIWTRLTPETVTGVWADAAGNPLPPNGLDPSLTIQADGSILVSGRNPEYAVYTITATIRDTTVTGIRLDAIDGNGSDIATFNGLPTGGPGRHGNGNVFVREFAVGQFRVPTITQEPQDGTLCGSNGATYTLSVGVDGQGPFAFQWRRSGSNVPDATGSTLVLDSPNDAGAYDVLVTSPCGTATSRTATVTRGCVADFNCDGFNDFFDYDAYVEAFEGGTPIADCNNDGFIDFFDYDCFVAAFGAGC